ncbi:MAG: DUF418 domain-containing protein [Acidobacteria bacterium]|nr:DUF418 domain-containing protein [Acidobacteriota bacterium]
MMLIGMALAKHGFLMGRAPDQIYRRVAWIGLLVGVSAALWSGLRWMLEGFAFLGFFLILSPTADLDRLCVGLAYISVLPVLFRTERLRWLTGVLSICGRMALTNYILASALAMLVFSGFGPGLFARLSRVELLAVVAAIWTVQIGFSQWWMARRRFGPLEWAWRILTYGPRSR